MIFLVTLSTITFLVNLATCVSGLMMYGKPLTETLRVIVLVKATLSVELISAGQLFLSGITMVFPCSK